MFLSQNFILFEINSQKLLLIVIILSSNKSIVFYTNSFVSPL